MARYYYNAKTEADGLKRLEIWWLGRQGYLAGNKCGVITWTHGSSGQKSSIGLTGNVADGDCPHIKLDYMQTDSSNGEKRHIEYEISLVKTPCYLGGSRYWFVCPLYRKGLYCGRRVGVLYKGGDYFGCRHCYRLTYASRNVSKRYRELASAITSEEKARVLLGSLNRLNYRGKPTRKRQHVERLLAKSKLSAAAYSIMKEL